MHNIVRNIVHNLSSKSFHTKHKQFLGEYLMNVFKKTSLALCVNAAIFASVASVSGSAIAQENADKVVGIEVIEVTARKRTENVKDVPISVSALTPKKLEVLGSSGMDVRSLSAKVPSLLIESSFGRTFPRFYIRGLGNTDFDLVSITTCFSYL